MSWATRLIGFVPRGNWDWPGGAIWCNGALYALIYRGYRWGSPHSENGNLYWGDEDGWWILRLEDKGFVRVLGGTENLVDWNWKSQSQGGNPIIWDEVREGYGPNATMGWMDEPRFAADDRYIYMLVNSGGIYRFDTVTLDFRLWQYNVANGYNTHPNYGMVDGDGNDAQLGDPSLDFFTYGDGHLWFLDYDSKLDVHAIRKVSVSSPYTMTTVATFPSYDSSWLGSINPVTGFPHAYDDDVFAMFSYMAAYDDGWLYLIQQADHSYPVSVPRATAGFRRFNTATGELQTIFVLEDDDELVPPNYHTNTAGDPSAPYYGQANNPAMQPERNWLPFVTLGGPYPAVIAGGKFYTRSWPDDGIEYNYYQAENGNRNVIIDLDDVLARAPFWTSHVNPDWELYPTYPYEWHTEWWGQKIYWSQGTNTQDHYAGQAGLTTDGTNVYVSAYTWWFDNVTDTYEAAQAISILYEHEPSGKTGYDVRVKFEGPALQAYSAQKSISLTKQIGPLQLS